MPIDAMAGALQSLSGVSSASGLGAAKKSAESSGFSELVHDALKTTNDEMVRATTVSNEHLSTGKHDLHEVIIALDRADLSFRMLSQMRNKVLDAYNDVMRMSV